MAAPVYYETGARAWSEQGMRQKVLVANFAHKDTAKDALLNTLFDLNDFGVVLRLEVMRGSFSGKKVCQVQQQNDEEVSCQRENNLYLVNMVCHL